MGANITELSVAPIANGISAGWLLSQSNYWIAMKEEQGAERTNPLSADV